MKRALLLSLIFTFVSVLTYAETNGTTSPKEPEKAAKQKEHNTTKKSSLMEKKIKEQMEREKNMPKSRSFIRAMPMISKPMKLTQTLFRMSKR
jgi:hypothetical protein